MMRLRTRGALAAAPLVLALALTACGSDGDDPQVATANNGKQAGASAGPSMDPEEMAIKYVECMRKNGIDMPDPVDGRIQLQLKKGQQQTMEKAQQACRKYDPQQNGSASSDPQQEERMRKFAECMRQNGVEKFPDPQPGQRGIKITGEVGQDPDLQKAQQQCQDLMGGGGNRGGATQ
jgi:hypothetical protein